MDNITIGVIRTSHGINGLLKVRSTSGETGHFARLREAIFRKGEKERIFPVEEVHAAGTEVLLKVKGIDTPEEAKLFAGWELMASRSHAAPLKPGEVYAADLLGCRLVRDGTELATVRSTIEGGASDLLEVELAESGRAVLVPFVDAWIGTVDIKARTIELREGWNLE